MFWQYLPDRWPGAFYQNKRDVILTLYSVGYIGVCALLASVANALADNLSRSIVSTTGRPPLLIDPILATLYPWYAGHGFRKDLPDIMILAAIIAIFVRVLTMGDKTCTTLRRVLYITGTMYLIRALHVNLTILPNPLESCRLDTQSVLLVRVLHVIDSEYVTCGDVFFSGHAIIFSVLWLVWLTYTPAQYRPGRYIISFVGCQALFSYFTLLLASYHYTIDVTISILLTTLLWTLYHMAVTSKDLRETSYLVRALDALNNCQQPSWEGCSSMECTYRKVSLEEGTNLSHSSSSSDTRQLSR